MNREETAIEVIEQSPLASFFDLDVIELAIIQSNHSPINELQKLARIINNPHSSPGDVMRALAQYRAVLKDAVTMGGGMAEKRMERTATGPNGEELREIIEVKELLNRRKKELSNDRSPGISVREPGAHQHALEKRLADSTVVETGDEPINDGGSDSG